MRIQNYSMILGFSLLTGCVGEIDTGPPSAELRSDPSVLVMDANESRTVIVEAFKGNEPEAVRWHIGTVGPGLIVREDSSYGQIYIGEELMLPAVSHSRAFTVTHTDTVTTSFVVSGGTAVLTIPVNPKVTP